MVGGHGSASPHAIAFAFSRLQRTGASVRQMGFASYGQSAPGTPYRVLTLDASASTSALSRSYRSPHTGVISFDQLTIARAHLR